jgi:hypothetical protein
VALGEVGGIPDPDLLQTYQAHWSWFVTWSGNFVQDGVTNPRELLTKIYNHEYVLTRDELGDFKNYDGSTTPPTSPPTSPAPSEPAPSEPAPTVSPTSSPTAQPAETCTAAYRVVGQWAGGWQGEVTVRNNGTAATAGWTATWTAAAGQSVTQSWNAGVTTTGTTVTATNATWNGALAPDGSVTFGFLGSGPAGAAPAVSCTLR